MKGLVIRQNDGWLVLLEDGSHTAFPFDMKDDTMRRMNLETRAAGGYIEEVEVEIDEKTRKMNMTRIHEFDPETISFSVDWFSLFPQFRRWLDK